MTAFDCIIVGAGGVLGRDLSVHGAQGLRVVGASVGLPAMPGFFIVSAVYVVAERLPM
jgi:choline dehydrogenase-like flavoprotein